MVLTQTVHVVDDDEGVRDSLRFRLEQEGHVVQTHDGAMALLQARLGPAGCVLTDFFMPDIDGLELQARLSSQNSQLPVIIMTGHAEVPLAVRAMRAGAVDFLEKPFADGDLLDAIRRALDRNLRAITIATTAAMASDLIGALTPREHQVLELLVTGKSNKEIGKALGTSPRTIDVHRARVFQKLQADTLPDLVHIMLAFKGRDPAP